MKKAILMLGLLLAAQVASATPTLLQFTNADVDLGTGSVIPLVGNEYLGFGIGVANAYRYIDGRDPFSDFPNDVPAPCPNDNNGVCNFGLTNNDQTAVMFFSVPNTLLIYNWWTLTDGSYAALDASFNVLDSFSAAAGTSGTEFVVGSVSYLVWSGQTGFVNVANIAFEPVPEPATMLLLGAGLLGTGVARRRKH